LRYLMKLVASLSLLAHLLRVWWHSVGIENYSDCLMKALRYLDCSLS